MFFDIRGMVEKRKGDYLKIIKDSKLFKKKYILDGKKIKLPRGGVFVGERFTKSEYGFVNKNFGVKGKIDLLLRGRYYPNGDDKFETIVVPFELKTGHK